VKQRILPFRNEYGVGDTSRGPVSAAVILLGILGLSLIGLQDCGVSGSIKQNKGGRQDGSYLIGVKTSLEKIYRDPARFKGDIGKKAIIKAARNEYESFQIVLFSQDGDLENINVESTRLVRDDHKAAIEKENINFFKVDYVKTRKPGYHVDYIGWWPDPLIPLEPFQLVAETIQPIWAIIHVPEDAAPGKYHGKIEVIPEHAEPETLQVDLIVWDFGIPKKPSFQAVFSLYENCIRDYYRYDSMPHDLLLKYYSFLLAHRINPTSLYIHNKPQPQLEDLQFCVDRGLNAVNISHLRDWRNNKYKRGQFSEKFKQNLMLELPRTISFLKERQWLDMAFIYGIDEPFHYHYDAVKETFSLVQQIAPGVRRVLTEGPVAELYGFVDVWVPRIDNYQEKKCRRRQALGEEIWWYVSASIHHPYPNLFVDYPAIDHRILFWLAWKYDISGFLYYSLNRWYTNYAQDRERWPDVPWNARTYGKYNGDGQLIYPGPAGEPYSSVRLEVIRDGMEDFEYLHMLQKRLRDLDDCELENKEILRQQAEDLITSISEKIVCNVTHYTKDPSQLLAYREMVADEIMKTNKIMNENSTSPNEKKGE
jgi:hypothetical protein